MITFLSHSPLWLSTYTTYFHPPLFLTSQRNSSFSVQMSGFQQEADGNPSTPERVGMRGIPRSAVRAEPDSRMPGHPLTLMLTGCWAFGASGRAGRAGTGPPVQAVPCVGDSQTLEASGHYDLTGLVYTYCPGIYLLSLLQYPFMHFFNSCSVFFFWYH